MSNDLWKPGDTMGARIGQQERDALEFAGFSRGLAAAKRALERETPLAAGSIAIIERLIRETSPRTAIPIERATAIETLEVMETVSRTLANAPRTSEHSRSIGAKHRRRAAALALAIQELRL